jgi:hypothetical protein
MSSSEQAFQSSPWISVWLKPRRTIENILAERPQRGVLLLGSLSVIAGTLSQLVRFGIEYRIFDWHIAAGLAIACAVAGSPASISRLSSSNGPAGCWADAPPPQSCGWSSHGA